MLPYLLSILSGLLLTVSFPETNWSFLAWAALLPLLFAIEGIDWRKTFAVGYAAGLAFYWSLFYWLNNVTVAGFLVLTCYLALYFPLFALGLRLLRARMPGLAWLLAPVLWTALEYVRTYAFTGLPWGLVGVTQYRFSSLIQVSSVTGVYGVSFVVILVNAAAYECLRRRLRGCLAPAATALLVFALVLLYGLRSLRAGGGEAGAVRVAIVQGNVPQEEKFGEGYREEITRRFISLTLRAVRLKPALVVWPETSVPGYYWYDPYIRSEIKRLEEQMATPLLLGSNHVYNARNPKYFNSAFLVDERGEAAGRYDKIHLVLFGEIVPWKRYFPFLMEFVPFQTDFTPGSEFTVFRLAGGDFAALICFEDIFPDLARGFVRRGARFLVNITNDAWFGKTSQPYQHAAHAVFRCVENAVSMVRATNTGLSCFVDPHGRMIGVLEGEGGGELFVAGTAVAEVPLSAVATFYTRHGNLFAVLCLAVAAAAIAYSAIRRSADVGRR